MSSSIGGVFGFFYVLFMGAIILFLAYVVTRFVGSKYMKTLKGKNINVIESVAIGLDKVLYLVKIGNQYFLISSCGKNINFLSQIDGSNVKYNPEDNSDEYQQLFDIGNFAKHLSFFKEKMAKQNKTQAKSKPEEEVDQNVEKIKDLFNNIKSPHKDGVE